MPRRVFCDAHEWINSRTCPIQPDYIEERHIRSVFFTFCSGTGQDMMIRWYVCGPPKTDRGENSVSPTKVSCNWSVLVEVLEVAK